MSDDGTPAVPVNVAPSLTVAINGATAESIGEVNGPDISVEDIKTILNHIWLRLAGGLAEAWEYLEQKSEIGKGDDIEEKWARQITEMLAATPYNGPGQTYLQNYNRDTHILKELERPLDPVYPIVTACAQLCTMATMVRGFHFNKGYFNAGNSKSTIEGLLPGPGKWWEPNEIAHPKWKNTIGPVITTAKLGPGSVFTFNGVDGPNSGAAHSAVILRVNKGRIQFLDTGGMNSLRPDKPRPSIMKSFDPDGNYSSNYDYQWTDHVEGPTGGVYAGLGVPPDAAAGKPDTIVSNARPLGFARLVLRLRPKKRGDILFASPLLLMHNADHNFSISRYLWSLRKIPGGKIIKATWIIYIPQDKLVESILSSERKTLLSEMLGKVYVDKGIPELLKYGMGKDTDIWSIEYLSSNCDRGPAGEEIEAQFDQGRVIIEHIRNRDNGKIPDFLPNLDPALKLPWNKPSGRKDLMLSRDDFNSFPYFLGEWDGKEWLVIV